MNLISQEIEIEAVPERVFDAISRQDALSEWWTEDVTAEPAVGTVAEFGFYDRRIVTRFRIEELERARRIRWHCIGGPEPYIGSEVVFELEPLPAGTGLHFEHRRLKGESAFIAHAEQSWKRALASLKSYAETGKGFPISM